MQFIKNGQWALKKAEQMDILAAGNAIKTDHEEQSLALALQPKYVHMVTLDPEDLSPSQLISFMRYMDEYSKEVLVNNSKNWYGKKWDIYTLDSMTRYPIDEQKGIFYMKISQKIKLNIL